MTSGRSGSGQIWAMLAAAVLMAHTTALGDTTSADDVAAIAPETTFESHKIHRPKFTWSGKRESRIGDYAAVTINTRGSTARKLKLDSKFSLDITTTAGATVNLHGKVHTVYTVVYDEPGFLQDVIDFTIEQKTGIYDDDVRIDSYASTTTTTIVAGDSPADTWQLEVVQHYKSGSTGTEKSGKLTNGSNTLEISSFFDEEIPAAYIEIREGSEVLARNLSGREYAFRADLNPKLKITLLAALETYLLNERGEWW